MSRPLAAFAALLLGVAAGCDVNTKSPPPGNTPADAGSVTVTPCKFDGVEAALEAAKGKVVLVDCWATWCGPCVASFPRLVEKHNKYSAKGLAVISLSLDKPSAAPA